MRRSWRNGGGIVIYVKNACDSAADRSILFPSAKYAIFETRSKNREVMSRKQTILFGIAVLLIVAIGFGQFSEFSMDAEKSMLADNEVELSWEMPSSNTDNTPLTDLAGYTVHCWNSVDQQTKTFSVDSSEITTFQLDELEPGTYQCAISAISAAGSQSALSNVVSRTVP